MGDQRTYSHTIVIRAITSVDGMTADWARIPYETLDLISRRIVNEVPNVNTFIGGSLILATVVIESLRSKKQQQ